MDGIYHRYLTEKYFHDTEFADMVVKADKNAIQQTFEHAIELHSYFFKLINKDDKTIEDLAEIVHLIQDSMVAEHMAINWLFPVISSMNDVKRMLSIIINHEKNPLEAKTLDKALADKIFVKMVILWKFLLIQIKRRLLKLRLSEKEAIPA